MAKKPYSLQCLDSPLSSSAVIETFTDKAVKVKKSDRLFGGPWMLEFEIPLFGDDRVEIRNSRSYLRNWFDDRLGFAVVMKASGQAVWRGVVWEMELSHKGEITSKRLEDVFTAVKTQYVNSLDEAVETAWQTNDAARNRYGLRELKLARTALDSSGAVNTSNYWLKRYSQVEAKTVAINRDEPEYVRVTCVGLSWMLQALFADDGDGSNTTVSAYISELVAAHNTAHSTYSATGAGYFTVGRVDTNSTTTIKRYDRNRSYWDTIRQLAEIGNAADNTTDLYVYGIDGSGVFYYRIADNTPSFEYRENEGIVSVTGGGNPWAVRPGVLRSRVRPGKPQVAGSFLQQTNDSWISEVVMSDGQDQPEFRFDDISERDFVSAAQRNLQYLERARNA